MSELPGWAENLDLAPHPEGGWYRETWRSDLTLGQPALPPEYTGPRSAGTAILFLLMPGQQSAWHTVHSAELWLFHRGSRSEEHTSELQSRHSISYAVTGVQTCALPISGDQQAALVGHGALEIGRASCRERV